MLGSKPVCLGISLPVLIVTAVPVPLNGQGAPITGFNHLFSRWHASQLTTALDDARLLEYRHAQYCMSCHRMFCVELLTELRPMSGRRLR